MSYDASLKARWDNKNVMDYAIEQAEERGEARCEKRGEARGEKRGEARGEYKKAVETARKMKSKGYSLEAISELTGLTIEEIGRL